MTNPLLTSTPIAPSPPGPNLPDAPPRPRRRLGRFLIWGSLLLLLAPPIVFGDSTYNINLFSKYVALAIFALGADLVWGYTGMLSLGQGLYFAIGAYCVALSLEMQEVAAIAHVAPGTLPPGYMNYTNLPVTHPDYHPPAALTFIAPLANIWVALAAAVVFSTLAAVLFGLMTFRLRIRGVYLSLITQALLLAVYTLVEDKQAYTGGFVGIKNLADLKLFGVTFNQYKYADHLYFLIAGALILCLIGCSLLVNSKFGKILTAIRDNENRVLALGYNTARYKLFVFALAGMLSGLAGALYVPANGLAGPTYLGIAFSINVVIWVAVGGRGTLFGAILGAILVGFAETRINDRFPNAWPLLLGGLFVATVLFLPHGIVGGLSQLIARLRRSRQARPSAAPAQGT